MWKRLLIECVVLPIVVLLAMPYVPVFVVRIRGNSMDYTLQDGQYAIAARYVDIQRGDIVMADVQVKRSWIEETVSQETTTISIAKRVVGLPNEQVSMTRGKVYINGQLLDEPYVDAQLQGGMSYVATVTLGPDEYFVLGDNREISLDSRLFGPIKASQIIGKLIQY